MRQTNTETTSNPSSEAGSTSALAINGTNVPIITMHDLTILPPDDLMSASQKVWTLGRSAHEATVACFKEIMHRYDGRKSNCPTFATVQDAFASIGVNYDAARKLVYRNTCKRELEAIAVRLHSLPASTETSTQISIFNIGDQVTVPDGDGEVSHVHQTTGKIDIVLDKTQEPVANVDPKNVTKVNGAPVIGDKLAKQKEHTLVAGELLIDAGGKKWIYADGRFSSTKMLTRSEVKEGATARLKAEREAARKRKEEEKKVRREQAASKEAVKISAAKAKREAAQAKREAKRAAAGDKGAKAAAKAKKRSPKMQTAVPVKVKTFVTKRLDHPVDDYVFATFNTDDLNTPLSKYKKLQEAEAETARLNAKYGPKGGAPGSPLAGEMSQVKQTAA